MKVKNAIEELKKIENKDMELMTNIELKESGEEYYYITDKVINIKNRKEFNEVWLNVTVTEEELNDKDYIKKVQNED